MVALTAIYFIVIVINAFAALITFLVVRNREASRSRRPVGPRRPDEFRYGPPPEGR